MVRLDRTIGLPKLILTSLFGLMVRSSQVEPDHDGDGRATRRSPRMRAWGSTRGSGASGIASMRSRGVAARDARVEPGTTGILMRQCLRWPE
jgi:hypothetical protein